MWDRIWNIGVNFLVSLTMPTICIYHIICADPFLNVSIEEAKGLEKLSNTLFVPFQYLFAGKTASLNANGEWELRQTFQYDQHIAAKSLASCIALPLSLTLGSTVKGFSLLYTTSKSRYDSLNAYLKSTQPHVDHTLYAKLGIWEKAPGQASLFESQHHARRAGDENHLQAAKKGVKEIISLFNQAGIAWWVDCGTLLGTCRYAGVIPWDEDIDLALLLTDFHNVKRVLNHLDPQKYLVQDWSGRDFPDTFLKVYVRESGELIDLYFYDLDMNAGVAQYIFSQEKSLFFFEWWKIRERRFTKPISLQNLFPLKKAFFDGIEVFVPNNPIVFLQRYYGENLAPVRIFDPVTNQYEKDLSHPYWQNAYVH